MALENIAQTEQESDNKKPRKKYIKNTIITLIISGAIVAIAATAYTINYMSNRTSEFGKGMVELKTNVYKGIYKDAKTNFEYKKQQK